MLAIETGYEISGNLLTRVVVWGVRAMFPPIVVFGSPVQRSKNFDISYWHIPICTKPFNHGLLGPTRLPNCKVYMDIEYRGSMNGVQLMWGDACFKAVKEYCTIDRWPMLVPIVCRKSGEPAVIADTRLHYHDERHYQFFGSDGGRSKEKFKLRLKPEGGKAIVSPHYYLIRVPDSESNGHFVVEIEYEGEGSQRKAS